MFGEAPDELIAISRSPAPPCHSIWRENTSASPKSLPRQVSTAPSPNAIARMPPFFEKSTAICVAMPMLPPFPMNMTLPPLSWAEWQRWLTSSEPALSVMRSPPALVHSASRVALERVSRYEPTMSRIARSLFKQAVQILDQRNLVHSATVADDLHLERADYIADEPDEIHRHAGRHQRRRDREKCIARADRIDDLAGHRRNRMNGELIPLERHAAVTALRHDQFRAVRQSRREVIDDIAGRRDAIAQGETSLRPVDADIVGPRIARDEIIAHVRAVTLGVDGQKSRRRYEVVDDLRADQSVAEIGRDHDIRGRADLLDQRSQLPFEVDGQRLVVHMIDFEKLPDRSGIDKSPLQRGR